MRLSAEGVRVLRAAERILPEIDLLKAEFDNVQNGQAGRLHIAIECHACLEWLFPVLNLFRHDFPDVDMLSKTSLAFLIAYIFGEKLNSQSRSLAIAVIRDEWLTSDRAGNPY